jgi:hypothetical protein
MADSFAYNSGGGKFRLRNGNFALAGTCKNFGADMVVFYEWDAPARDLDTGTTFLGVSVGWSIGGGQAGIIRWPSGDNVDHGPEIVYVFARATLAKGLWAGRTVIDCCAGWYIPAGGGGPARIRVALDGVTRSKTISPGAQSGGASTPVASITLFGDMTFTLT